MTYPHVTSTQRGKECQGPLTLGRPQACEHSFKSSTLPSLFPVCCSGDKCCAGGLAAFPSLLEVIKFSGTYRKRKQMLSQHSFPPKKQGCHAPTALKKAPRYNPTASPGTLSLSTGAVLHVRQLTHCSDKGSAQETPASAGKTTATQYFSSRTGHFIIQVQLSPIKVPQEGRAASIHSGETFQATGI